MKYWTISTETVPQINIWHQTSGPGSSESSKQDKCQNKNKQKIKPNLIVLFLITEKSKENLGKMTNFLGKYNLLKWNTLEI